jgi:very-short-patch-repair endonuclease
MDVVSVVESLERLGGVATRGALIAATDRIRVDRALEVGDIVVLARGRYALPEVDASRAAAHRLSGAVSWRSAAQLHEWELLHVPDRPEITVPASRKVAPSQRSGVVIHRGDLHESEVDDGVATRARTLVDCMRGLPFGEALAVADSALRHGFSARLLGGLAEGAHGPGSRQMRRVASLASADKANPFESGLHAIAAQVPGLRVRPQVSIYDPGFLGRPDLVDERLKIILEADSFVWHGSRGALRRDAARYTEFGVRGWLVLRFAWEHVMFEADWVLSVLAAAVAERSDQRCLTCRAA